MAGYDPIEVQARWQARWARDRLDELDLERVGRDEKLYNLVEFPYPSAEGLHVGHTYTYAGADTYGRYQRMRGRAVFQPIGFDAFGIHTENYALQVGEDPTTLTARTVERYRGQLRRLGAAWDWSHQLATSDPAYYRWTQWVFLRLHAAGLAVRQEAPVVWCPSCLTVLANEQLEGDRCERCGTRVEWRTMRQWFLRITAYADRLLEGLDGLDWPEAAKRQQRAWIGRSERVEIDFGLEGGGRLAAFTTRPGTLPGATFLALASPEASLAGQGRGGREGRFTGRHALHPVTGRRLPVWEAAYVVAGYGGEAVMGVPSRDERDRAFAAAHGLPLGDAPDEPDGAVAGWLEARGRGRRATRYRLRDWLISRQRYWGPPIPIVHCDGCGPVAVPDDDLPVLLPAVADFRPTGGGSSPLASVPASTSTRAGPSTSPATICTPASSPWPCTTWAWSRSRRAASGATPAWPASNGSRPGPSGCSPIPRSTGGPSRRPPGPGRRPAGPGGGHLHTAAGPLRPPPGRGAVGPARPPLPGRRPARAGRPVRDAVYVPDRLLNLVTQER